MRTRVAVLLFLSLAAPSLAQSTSVVVREKLDPPSGAVIGQPIRLLVDVLFPDTMPRPPRVSVPDTPGTQIMRFESQGVTMRDQIGGQNYVGQQFEFIVFPRRGGAFTLPRPASRCSIPPATRPDRRRGSRSLSMSLFRPVSRRRGPSLLRPR